MSRLLMTLKDVTSEILETMFFLFLELPEPRDEASPPSVWRGQGIQSRITIQGPHILTLGLTVPLDLSREMAANFLGRRSPEIPIENQLDVVREAANMIGGTFLTKLKNSAAYSLQIPEVQMVTLENLPFRAGKNTVRVEINQQPLELFIEGG